MSESEKLTAFLLALQTSPTERENFEIDPIGEMIRFSLDPKTIRAVLRKDTKVLWRILGVPTFRVPPQIGKVIRVEKITSRQKRKKP